MDLDFLFEGIWVYVNAGKIPWLHLAAYGPSLDQDQSS